MNNEKKPTRKEIVRSLRICSRALLEGCGGCVFEPEHDEDAVICVDGQCGAAADLIDQLTDRCARYAEEIMELRQRLKKYENAEMLAAQQNEKDCPFKYWCDAVKAAKNNNEKENTSMKIFISQPMKGKTNEEIKTERERLIAKAREHYGEDIEVIDSFFENAPADARPLWFLGKSLELLSTADVAVFAPDWESARGCRVENHCAIMYGIEVLEVCGK